MLSSWVDDATSLKLLLTWLQRGAESGLEATEKPEKREGEKLSK